MTKTSHIIVDRSFRGLTHMGANNFKFAIKTESGLAFEVSSEFNGKNEMVIKVKSRNKLSVDELDLISAAFEWSHQMSYELSESEMYYLH